MTEQQVAELCQTEHAIGCASGSDALLLALMAADVGPGDEVIIPAPYWVSYPDMVLLGGGEPVVVEAGIETNFKLAAEQLEAAITPKTKWFIFNSPSNPTGKVYSDEEYRELGDVLAEHPKVFIACDDIYERAASFDEVYHNLSHEGEIPPDVRDAPAHPVELPQPQGLERVVLQDDAHHGRSVIRRM